MRTFTFMLVVVAVPFVLFGCGGSPTQEIGPASEDPRGAPITQSPAIEQLRAELATLGKPMPDFIAADGTVDPSAADAGEMSTASMMTGAVLFDWTNLLTVKRNRVNWIECNLTDRSYWTDVYVDTYQGDPDLFVFSPLRYSSEPGDSLQLIGYDARVGDGHVGSFRPSDWGGTGRVIAAVWGYNTATTKFWVKFY